MMNDPFFSVILPTYNRAHILTGTIVSVLSQNFSDWELIVVDDGSKDNTKQVVSEIRDDRVRYVYQENAERSAARNNGIRHARGQYICFLDSDDFFEPIHLETLFENIKNNKFPEALFLVHAFDYINGVKSVPELVSIDKSPLIYFFTEAVVPARICVHADILKTINFDEDIVIVEDLVLWVKIASVYPVFEIKEYTVCYTMHSDNSVNLKNNSYLVRYRGLKLFFIRYPETAKKIPYHLRKKIISDTLFGMARYHALMNQYWKMRKYLCRSIAVSPIHKQTKAKVHMMFFPEKHKVHD
jgi:glycosyltransferase involved in cell wall biosynthesis